MSKALREPRRLSLEEIIEAVCTEFGVKKAAVCGDSQVKWLCTPRHVCAHLAIMDHGYSAAAMGRALNKDHTTVLDSLDSLNARLWVEYELKARVARLRTILEAMTRQPVPPARILVTVVRPPKPPTLAQLLVVIPDLHKVKRSARELKAKGWSARGIAKRLGIDPRVAAHLIGVNWENVA